MVCALRELQAFNNFEIEVVDVDSDPVLEVRYGERVPVLVSSGAELCHYHLDATKVNEYLKKIG